LKENKEKIVRKNETLFLSLSALFFGFGKKMSKLLVYEKLKKRGKRPYQRARRN
jgi:hypothetical protein